MPDSKGILHKSPDYGTLGDPQVIWFRCYIKLYEGLDEAQNVNKPYEAALLTQIEPI